MLKLNGPLAAETLLMPGVESGFTNTEKLWVALKLGVPLSDTFRLKLLVEFACVTSGRNEKAPLVVLSVALVAPPSSAKVSVCGGWLVSVALAVNATVWPTLTVWLAIGARVGGVLVGATPFSVRAIIFV